MFLTLLSLIPGAVAYSEGVIDPFLHGQIASVMLSMRTGRVNFETSQFTNTPSLGFLLIILSSFSGLNPATIEYFPIAALSFLFAAVVLARRFSRLDLGVMGIAMVLSLRWLPLTLETTWTHTFGFTLYLLFVGIVIKTKSERKSVTITLLWILFLGAAFYSYTVELWLIGFVGALLAVKWLRKERKSLPLSSVFIAMIVTFLMFGEVIYRVYIPAVEQSGSKLSTGFEYFVSTLLRASPPVPYAWVPPSLPPYLLALQLLWYATLFLPIAFLISSRVRTMISPSSQRQLPQLEAVVLALTAVWFVDAASYAPIGAVAVGILRYILLAAPFLSIVSARLWWENANASVETRKFSRRMLAYSATLIVLSVAIFAGTLQQPYVIESNTRYAESQSAGFWLLVHSSNTTLVVSDHNTQGQFAIVAAGLDRFFFSNNLYNSTSIEYLFNTTKARMDNHYFNGKFVVINLNLASSRTSAGGWIDFEPMASHLETIETNINLNKLYDDGSCWVMLGT